jgi:hypothetical protein
MNGLQCQFLASQGSANVTVKRIDDGPSYVMLPKWSILGPNGIRDLPQDCRPPPLGEQKVVKEQLKPVKEVVIENTATGKFIPALEITVPAKEGETPEYRGLWWGSIWHAERNGNVTLVGKAEKPILAHQVEFSEDGQSIWQVTWQGASTGDVERISIQEDSQNLDHKKMWRITRSPNDRLENGKLCISPGQKWMAWLANDRKEVRIRSFNNQPSDPIEHVLFSGEYGEAWNGVFGFANDELLYVNKSIIRLGANRDEVSCVQLGGPIVGASADGRRVAVFRMSRVSPNRGMAMSNVCVYSCDIAELLATAKWVINRPPTNEESQLLLRTKRK